MIKRNIEMPKAQLEKLGFDNTVDPVLRCNICFFPQALPRRNLLEKNGRQSGQTGKGEMGNGKLLTKNNRKSHKQGMIK